MDGSRIDREDCLIPYTGPDGKDSTLDIGTMTPGDFFDPASKWPILTSRPQQGAIPINWLFFKGDMMQHPSALHPFEGPWQKVYKVTFAIDLLSMNSSTVHQVMTPVDVNDYFWETVVQRNRTSKYRLSINMFKNMSCPYYQFGAAAYWWTLPKDINRKETYQLRLNSVDTVGFSGNGTTATFLSGGFLLDGEKTGTSVMIGGSFAILVFVSLIFGGLYFLWQRRQRYRPWILDQIYRK